jgi:hypothetical protein
VVRPPAFSAIRRLSSASTISREASVLCESTTQISPAQRTEATQNGTFATSFLIGIIIEIPTIMVRAPRLFCTFSWNGWLPVSFGAQTSPDLKIVLHPEAESHA